jgi:hypothetical protein
MSDLVDSARAYAVTVNGQSSWEIKIRRGGPPVYHEIAGFLDRLNGATYFSVGLWELPEGTPFEHVKFDCWPLRYLQAAGNRDRMTVEIRRDGEPGERHFVIGTGDTIETERTEEIRWDAYSTHVYKVEVFTAAQAVALFLSYWQTNDVPQGYRLRAIDL